MDNSVWYCLVNGKKEGPYTLEAFRGMAAAAPPPQDMLVWTDGMAEWQPLGATPLASILKGMVAPPAAPLGATLEAGARNLGQQMSSIAADASASAPGFVDAIKVCLQKYADFNGRATRPEYWWFVLFNFVLGLVLFWAPILSIIVSLALLLPSVAVAIRRLHDIDKSGWWLLLVFVPLIGLIALIIFFCQRGTEGRNRFG
jgi:uncharacterized membrane protein YhaH (DUF805 family)